MKYAIESVIKYKVMGILLILYSLWLYLRIIRMSVTKIHILTKRVAALTLPDIYPYVIGNYSILVQVI